MTITPRALSINLNDALYLFFSDPLLEGKIPFVYKDGAGIPTLGVGYALVVDVGINGGHDWQIRDNYKAALQAAGITLTKPQLDDLDAKLGIKGVSFEFLFENQSCPVARALS